MPVPVKPILVTCMGPTCGCHMLRPSAFKKACVQESAWVHVDQPESATLISLENIYCFNCVNHFNVKQQILIIEINMLFFPALL